MNLQKYFESFPYSVYFVSKDGGTLFYIKEGTDGKKLHRLSLEGPPDLALGELVFDQDLNTRSFRPYRYDSAAERLYVIADENHDEKYNLWCLDVRTKQISKVTDVEFASGVLLTPDFQSFYYGDRKIRADRTFETTFEKIDIATGERTSYFSDKDWSYRMSWGHPCLTDNPDILMIPLYFESWRNRANLAEINLKRGTHRLLLPESWENMMVIPAWDREWKGHVYFQSEHTGHLNLYSYETATGLVQPVTLFTRRNQGFELIEKDQALWVAAVFPVPEEERSQLILLNVETHETREASLPGSCWLADAGHDIWIAANQISDLPKRQRLDWETLKPNLEIGSSTRPKDELVHSTHHFLKYPTFDGLDIPAYLALPTGVPVRAAVVRAFYGGSDTYSFADQILLEQGIAVLSPAVRGSWGWGQDWENRLKGDLGGKEILDVVWGARFLEKELGLDPSRIGIEGGSHGGYAVLRALTMPAQFAGQDSKYPWGFGICWAGFADLIRFHEDSWIADWLTDLLGPMAKNKDLYVDRSPLTHFEELDTPVFIVHGTHDRRVPPSTMTAFLEKLQASSKPHKIHFVEGQGHTGGDQKDKTLQFEAQQEFLRNFVLEPGI